MFADIIKCLPVVTPIGRIRAQVAAVLRLRRASEAMEVEDFGTARREFLAAAAMEAPRLTRIMAYHGAVIAELRLARYDEALALAQDASTLISSDSAASGQAEFAQTRQALDEAGRFARWALKHPGRARALQEREARAWRSRLRGGQQKNDPDLAASWPGPLRTGYRLVVQGLTAIGLVAAASQWLGPARWVLAATQRVARYDRSCERDVCWHLTQVCQRLGESDEAERQLARYRSLDQEVRQTLIRRRWTN